MKVALVDNDVAAGKKISDQQEYARDY